MKLELLALAEALEHWPRRAEVFGRTSDDATEVLVHGRVIDGVVVFSPPVHIDTRSTSRA